MKTEIISNLISRLEKLERQSVPEYMTVKEASAFTKFKASSIYEMINRKAIPHIRISGRIRFVRKDLIEWMEGGRRSKKDDEAKIVQKENLRIKIY